MLFSLSFNYQAFIKDKSIQKSHSGVHALDYCEKQFIRGELIFVDFVGQPNNVFMNPMKYIFIFYYTTTPMIFYILISSFYWKFDVHKFKNPEKGIKHNNPTPNM